MDCARLNEPYVPLPLTASRFLAVRFTIVPKKQRGI